MASASCVQGEDISKANIIVLVCFHFYLVLTERGWG